MPPLIWEIPLVAAALVIGTMATSQAGWSGAEVIVLRNNAPFIAELYFVVGAGISCSAFALVQRIAKPVLWVMVRCILFWAINYLTHTVSSGILESWKQLTSMIRVVCWMPYDTFPTH